MKDVINNYEEYFVIQQSIDGGKTFEDIGFKIHDEDQAIAKLARHVPQCDEDVYRIMRIQTRTSTLKTVFEPK